MTDRADAPISAARVAAVITEYAQSIGRRGAVLCYDCETCNGAGEFKDPAGGFLGRCPDCNGLGKTQ